MNVEDLKGGDEISVKSRLGGKLTLTFIESITGYEPGSYFTKYIFRRDDNIHGLMYLIQSVYMDQEFIEEFKKFEIIPIDILKVIIPDAIPYLRENAIDEITQPDWTGSP